MSEYEEYLQRFIRSKDLTIEEADKLALSQQVKKYYEQKGKISQPPILSISDSAYT